MLIARPPTWPVVSRKRVLMQRPLSRSTIAMRLAPPALS